MLQDSKPYLVLAKTVLTQQVSVIYSAVMTRSRCLGSALQLGRRGNLLISRGSLTP